MLARRSVPFAGSARHVDELDATLAAIERSDLNAFSYLDPEEAGAVAAERGRRRSRSAAYRWREGARLRRGLAVHRGVRPAEGRVADHDSTIVSRLRAAGAVLVGLTTSSEFGGVNLTYDEPQRRDAQPVGPRLHAGRFVRWRVGRGRRRAGHARRPAATAGARIRIPAGFTGLPGLKARTAGSRRARRCAMGSLTAVRGCLSRSVRDIARYFDVTQRLRSPRPVQPAPRRGLGSRARHVHDAARQARRDRARPRHRGRAIAEVAAMVVTHGEALARGRRARARRRAGEAPRARLRVGAGRAYRRSLAILGDRYPDCEADLTLGDRLRAEDRDRGVRPRGPRPHREPPHRDERDHGRRLRRGRLRHRSRPTPTSRSAAEGPLPTHVNGQNVGAGQQRRADDPGEHLRQPGDADPVGTDRGLPVGLQVLGRTTRSRCSSTSH